MNAKDLRIGNWVERNDMSHDTIGILDLVYLCQGEDITRIHPIPLTEEWLFRFGFEKNGNKMKLEIELHEDNFFYFVHNKGFSKIQFVHQLQNLVFALTGDELTIKPL